MLERASTVDMLDSILLDNMGDLFIPLQEDGLDLDLGLFNDDMFGFLDTGNAELGYQCTGSLARDIPAEISDSALDDNGAGPHELAVPLQRCCGPKRKAAGPVRLVTTELPGTPELVGTVCCPDDGSPNSSPAAALSPAPPSATELCAAAPTSPATTSSDSQLRFREETVDTDSEDSNDTDEKGLPPAAAAARANKRKAPEVDWRSIEDVAERRRQRRLAKNRVTAARSRERKKSQWAEMEAKMQVVEKSNRELKTMMENLKRENDALRFQLSALTDGAVKVPSQGGKKPKADPAAVSLVIAILLLLASTLLADGATLLLMLGIPLMLLPAFLCGRGGQVLPDLFIGFWAVTQASLRNALSGNPGRRGSIMKQISAVLSSHGTASSLSTSKSRSLHVLCEGLQLSQHPWLGSLVV